MIPERGAKRIFLTGANGFLGSHLCNALLKEGHHIIALVRASKTETGHDRLTKTLARVAQDDYSLKGRLDRLEVVEGDISAHSLGLSTADNQRLKVNTDEVWHSAASLSFLEEDRESILRMNLDGTRNILQWTSETTGKRLHHVSTAYIAGKRTGIVREDEIDVGQQFKNPYEDSKCQSEVLVDAAHRAGSVSASIYRPSIVIGESRTGYTTHFHGVYAFIRGLWATIERLRRRQTGSDIVQLALRMRGSESSTLNFVPVDYVTQAMVAIGRQPSSAGSIYHLANPEGTENRLWLDIVCDQLRVKGIHIVDERVFEDVPMTKMETFFQRQMSFYYQYLNSEPRFDCSNAVKALSNTGIACPEVTAKFARKMTGWYIDLLNRKISCTSNSRGN